MMPILNSVYKSKKSFASEFFCPNCFVITSYVMKPLSEDMTLYPIPFFETNGVSHVIECQVCQYAFAPDLLARNIQGFLKLVGMARYQLDRGISPGSLKLRLMSDGLNEVSVDKLLTLAQR